MSQRFQSLRCQLIRSLFHLRNISKLQTLFSRCELDMIIHASMSSLLDHCNSLCLCLSKKNRDRLQSVQNPAARLLTKTR